MTLVKAEPLEAKGRIPDTQKIVLTFYALLIIASVAGSAAIEGLS